MPRVLLRFDNLENQRLLADWLADAYEVVADGAIAESPFDLCLLDGPALGRERAAIQARKAREDAVFLPFLLATRRPPGGLPAEAWAAVDEVIFVPTEKAELRARLESLLRARRLSLELARRYDELKAYDRQKDEFLSLITHELRTPLTSILGYAEFLEDEIGGPLTAQQREFVAQIEGGTRRVDRLVADLLDFARLETGTFKLRPETGDLGDQAREAIASLRPQAESRRVTLAGELPDAPLPMRLDPQRMVQVFVNLLNNALKFTPPGGTIRVRVLPQGEAIRCEVADSGPGIAPEDVPRLFKRFSQLQAGVKVGGTGLGLSICKAIVEGHGGTIGVESAPGQGATFWFVLPAEGAPEPA